MKFVWAIAKIVGDKIKVSANEINAPMYLGYGWADNPDCNLFNIEGLTATPFRPSRPK